MCVEGSAEGELGILWDVSECRIWEHWRTGTKSDAMQSELAFREVTLVKHPQSHTRMLSGRQLGGTHQDWTMEQAKMKQSGQTVCSGWAGFPASSHLIGQVSLCLLLASPSEQPLTPRDGMWRRYSREMKCTFIFSNGCFAWIPEIPWWDFPCLKSFRENYWCTVVHLAAACQRMASTGVQQSARKNAARCTDRSCWNGTLPIRSW